MRYIVESLARLLTRAERREFTDMDNNKLSMESHFTGHPINKFSRELMRRQGASES